MTDKQLTIDEILNIQDFKTEKVEIPEWGGHVVVKTMTAEARDAYEISLFQINESGGVDRKPENGRAKLVAACTLSPDGTRMFKGEDQVKALGQKSAAAVNRIFEVCQKLNAVSDEDMEELTGNSEADQP